MKPYPLLRVRAHARAAVVRPAHPPYACVKKEKPSTDSPVGSTAQSRIQENASRARS